MPTYQCGTVDVCTEKPLTGHPVAVVLEAHSLRSEQMQALAAEFHYVETTFVLPPADPRHTAKVRISARPEAGITITRTDDLSRSFRTLRLACCDAAWRHRLLRERQ